MNGQKPELTNWTEVIEDLKIRINNGEIQVLLFKAQLVEAESHVGNK